MRSSCSRSRRSAPTAPPPFRARTTPCPAGWCGAARPLWVSAAPHLSFRRAGEQEALRTPHARAQGGGEAAARASQLSERQDVFAERQISVRLQNHMVGGKLDGRGGRRGIAGRRDAPTARWPHGHGHCVFAGCTSWRRSCATSPGSTRSWSSVFTTSRRYAVEPEH